MQIKPTRTFFKNRINLQIITNHQITYVTYPLL